VAAWPELPDTIRAGILAMVKAACGTAEDRVNARGSPTNPTATVMKTADGGIRRHDQIAVRVELRRDDGIERVDDIEDFAP
jgi:hypothetical protein